MLTKLGSCCCLLRAAPHEYADGDGGNLLTGYKRISGDDSSGRPGFKGVPGDVKKGHFAVLAFNGSELQRFLLPLGCLSNPAFLKLLEKAKEEYGFEQEGVLTLPCHINELEGVFHKQLDQNRKNQSRVQNNCCSKNYIFFSQ